MRRRASRAAGLLLLLAAAGGLSSCAAPGRGEPFLPRLDAAPSPPRVIWSRDVGRGIEVRPLLDDTGLLVAATDRHIELLDAATGRRLWRKRLDGSLADRPLLAFGHLVAATSRPEGAVSAVDLKRRKSRWKSPVGDPSGSPVLFEGTLLIPTVEGKVFALVPADGRTIWVTSLGSSSWGAASFDPSRALLLVPGRSGSLFGVDARGGERRWVASLGSPLVGVDSDTAGIVAASTDGQVFGVDSGRGQTLWKTALAIPLAAPPVLADGLVLLAGLDGTVLALRRADGREAWRRPLGGPFRAAPAVHAGRVAVAAVSGQIWELALDSGRILGGVRHPETVIVSPVAVGEGWIVAGERGLVSLYAWESGR